MIDMRWLFLIVLSLNLAYIAWQTSVSREDSSVHVQPLKNVQPIVLLSELKPQSVQVGEVAESASQQKQDVADKTIEVEKVNPVTIESAEVVSTETVTANIEATVAAEVKKPVPEPGLAKYVSAPSSVPPLSVTSCYTLGPFRDLDKLRNFTREIKSYVLEADFRGREEKERSLFFVYLRPEKSHKEALETGKRLKEKKIKDFYVIREGEKIHGISLGHFRNKDGAYGLAKKVKKLGFDVQVEPVYKTYTVYWLDYQLAGGVSIPESIFDKYTKKTKKDKVSRLSRDCGG